MKRTQILVKEEQHDYFVQQAAVNNIKIRIVVAVLTLAALLTNVTTDRLHRVSRYLPERLYLHAI